MNNLPGFTAEASIDKSATNFAGDLVSPDAAAVVPQGCTWHTVSDGVEVIKYETCCGASGDWPRLVPYISVFTRLRRYTGRRFGSHL